MKEVIMTVRYKVGRAKFGGEEKAYPKIVPGETVTDKQFREEVARRYTDPEAWREDSPEKPIDLWRMLAGLHPWGVWENPEEPGDFRLELGAVMRQIHWENLAHLRTVQRFKETIFHLPIQVTLPREGYLTVPKFYE